MEHELDDGGMNDQHSEATERWAKLAMQARHSRLSRELFDVEVDPPRMGRFELEALQGTGAMGAVFAARDPRLDRRVAVKLLTIPDQAVHAQRLLAEAKVLAKLSHPNVVTVYEAGVDGDDLFLVMELVDGGPLSQLWLEGTRSLRELLDAFVQAGEGLAAVHEAGIIHCDFKPSNVVVTREGRVKVADFGLARLTEVATSQATSPSPEARIGTSTTTCRGTPAYMAPELLTGARPSERSDLFSFCVSLWEALHGRRPYPGGDAHEGSLEPRRVRPVPRWLDRALVRGLAVDPSARWATMSELVAVLRDTPQRRRSRLGAAAFLVAIPVAAGMGQYLSRGPTCTDRTEDLDAVWNAERRDAIETAWQAGRPFERESWPVVRDQLDAWARAWIDAQHQACRDTFEEKRRSELAFDRAMACLDRRRAALGSATELLASGKPEVAAAATKVLDALDHPSTCLDEPAAENLARPPMPVGPEAVAIARGIDRARLHVAAGDSRAAIAALDATWSESLEGSPLVSEHRLVRGRALSMWGRWDEAVESLLQAAQSALRGGDDGLVAEAFVELAELEVDRQHHAQASGWVQLADAAQQRVGAEPRKRARVHDVVGLLALRNGDAERAEVSHREALGLLQDTQASDPLSFTIRRHLAMALAEQGHHRAAKAIYVALADEVEALYGSLHPDLGVIEKNLAIDARARGERAIALAHAQRGHQLLVGAFGEDSIRVAPTLTLVADLWSDLGVPTKAAPLAAQAWRLQRDHLPEGHSERGSALALLAWIQMQTGDFEASLASYLELEHEYQQGPHRDQLPTISHDIGYCLCALGRCAEAHARFSKLYLELPDDDPLAPYAASGLASSELARSHHARAEALATQTLERMLAAQSDDAELRAELRLIVIACRLAAGDRATATAVAREAATDAPSNEIRAMFGEDVSALLAEVEQADVP